MNVNKTEFNFDVFQLIDEAYEYLESKIEKFKFTQLKRTNKAKLTLKN